MTNKDDWVIIGRFGRPHGIKGAVKVHSFTEPRDNILKYNDWYIRLDAEWKVIKVLSTEIHDKGIVARLEDFPDRELVAELTNVEIAIPREQLSSLAPGEYYWHQLIGMSVVNTSGEPFGKVVEIMSTGSNDVLIIEGEKRYLIPYLPDKVIISIDDSQQLITVDWDLDF